MNGLQRAEDATRWLLTQPLSQLYGIEGEQRIKDLIQDLRGDEEAIQAICTNLGNHAPLPEGHHTGDPGTDLRNLELRHIKIFLIYELLFGNASPLDDQQRRTRKESARRIFDRTESLFTQQAGESGRQICQNWIVKQIISNHEKHPRLHEANPLEERALRKFTTTVQEALLQTTTSPR